MVSSVVVVGSVVVVVGAVVVVDDVVLDVCVGVGAGAPPPLPRARVARPQMMTAIKITTAKPHRASTHRLRYHGEGFATVAKFSVSSEPRE